MGADATRLSFLHYALGGGLGHLVRQWGIAHALQKQSAGKSKSTIVTTSEFAPTVAKRVAQLDHDRVQFKILSPNCLPDEAKKLMEDLIATERFACLIVDVFPRGLGGELVGCFAKYSNLPKVLVARNLPAAYLQNLQIEPFVRSNYKQVFRIEPYAPFEKLPQSQLTCPVVFQPETANEPGSVAGRQDERRVLVVGSGTSSECNALRDLSNKLQAIASKSDASDDLRLCNFSYYGPTPDLNDDQFSWPLSARLNGFDLVIGNAGYNLFWETKLAQIPAILFARRRKYDNQVLRSEVRWPIQVNDLLGMIGSKLQPAPESTCSIPRGNSIDDLAASILNLLKIAN